MSGFDYQFDWNEQKAQSNARKHGVTFLAAGEAISDPLAVTIFDPDHSTSEEPRWLTTGCASDGTCVVVVHIWQDVSANSARVRIISARKATKHEQKNYEDSL